ncbi:MAG: Hsp70 family protein [Planctomycetales bacterium]|nr:Hsp70 family protein [Planctomycetales bacterium]
MANKVFGIDLGTTFSCIAQVDEYGRPEPLTNLDNEPTTPSVVLFDSATDYVVGKQAKRQARIAPENVAALIKRHMGDGEWRLTIHGQEWSAPALSSLIIRSLAADAERATGEPVSDVVITVPAYFGDEERKATKLAGEYAGLNVVDIINEPTAAAITYGVEQGFLSTDGMSGQRETVLVYDLGGGTFDVTVMEIENGNFNTIATAGDVYLGGIDWDGRIVDLIAEAFVAEHGIDPRQDPQAEQELLRKANQTKHALTQRDSISVAFVNDGRRLRTEITAKQFADRCVDLVERTLMTVHLVLDDAGIDWPDLTRLILVGGSTRMPMIRDELQRLSGMEVDRSLSPDEAVSHGAALYAGMLLAGKNDKSGISVSNVNSHDLGVLAVDPKSDKPRRKIMIPRNSKLPAQKTVRFRTHSDNQANVKIQVVEGGDKRGINATSIGKCVVAELPTGTPKGTSVDVRFDYTADGRLTVHASLPEFDRKITMTLDRASGLTDEEISEWTTRLDEGFSDAMLANLPEIRKESEAATPEISVDDLPAEIRPDAPEDSVKSNKQAKGPSAPSRLSEASPKTVKTSKAAAVLNINADDDGKIKTKMPSVAGKAGPGVGTIQIATHDQRNETRKFTAADAQNLPDVLGAPSDVIREKPKLELDPKDAQSTAKADANDLAMLASLSRQSPSDSKPQLDIPFIITDSSKGTSAEDKSSKSARPKKSGGFFGRKKK